MKLKDLGEFGLINRLSKRINLSRDVVKGIGDDAAVFKHKRDSYLLFTTDMFVEGRHFYKRSKGYLVGKKCLSANISDIAAMGGIPKFTLVSLGAPGSLGLRYVDELYRGIRDVCKRFNVDLAGGDTVYSEKIVINIALLGEVEKKNLVLRNGAREGDSIFITGSIGGSIRGKHLDFTPRLKEARFLVENFKVHSMIDSSDGLIADLGHILRLSKKGADIYERKIPVSKNAKSFDTAIRDGEDFELIFTISKRKEGRLIGSWPFRTSLSRIGEVYKASRNLNLIRKNGERLKIKPTGYSHF